MARGKVGARQGAADKKKKTGSGVKAGASNAKGKREKVGHPSV